jgi:hypothetical protein
MLPDPLSDPFEERSQPLARGCFSVLGANIHFESNSRELFRLVNLAYGGLPKHRLSKNVPDLHVRLHLRPAGRASSRWQPAQMATFHGVGLLGGSTDSANFVAVSPRERAALVGVAAKMLRFPYHTRYELIEFAVFTLASRAQPLIPLHAACVGADGNGILLMGASGAGKSTVSLHCLLNGMDFVAEDSIFVTPDTLLATGVANFVHIRADSLRWLGRSAAAAEIRRCPVIRRRSGMRKFEVDLRGPQFRLAKDPLKIRSVVFLSSQRAVGKRVLKPISKLQLRSMLATTQAYAVSRPQWSIFSENIAAVDAFELRRGRHPLESVESLRSLLAACKRRPSQLR